MAKQRYYLITADTREATMQLLNLLMEKAGDDVSTYPKNSEEWKLAKKCLSHFIELLGRYVIAESGTFSDE